MASRIEQHLNKLKTWEGLPTPNVEIISNGLCLLVELYKSMNDFLNLPRVVQLVFSSSTQNAKWVDEILEYPIKFLDICGITREIVSQIKENVGDLQSSLRRRNGDMRVESSITKFISFRKNMKKDVKRCVAILKQMGQDIETSNLNMDQEIIRVLREVNAISIYVLQSVLVFLSASKSKKNKWFISRFLVNKGRVACESQQASVNNLEMIHDALIIKNNRSSNVQDMLVKLEVFMNGLERGLENLSRCLITSRASLLNSISSC